MRPTSKHRIWLCFVGTFYTDWNYLQTVLLGHLYSKWVPHMMLKHGIFHTDTQKDFDLGTADAQSAQGYY